jgi:putative glutamine amidotransferase
VTRPVVGVCAAVERIRWGAWEVDASLLPRTYTDAIQAAGGIGVILPADDTAAEAPGQLLDLLDALVLAGGSDVDPAAYGAQPDPETGPTTPERDRFELALAYGALERDMPLLGICRGMEMLNVACGGTLEQHIDRLDLHRHTRGVFGDHEVRLEPGSLAARAVGAEGATVKSHHHQGVGEVGEGLEVTGWSVPDDQVEAVELPERAFALGVLWHPEEDVRSSVVGALVEEARAKVGAE